MSRHLELKIIILTHIDPLCEHCRLRTSHPRIRVVCLEVLLLIIPDRNLGGPVEEDIGGLKDRIGVEADRRFFLVGPLFRYGIDQRLNVREHAIYILRVDTKSFAALDMIDC